MGSVTDFYQYKYSRNGCYVDLCINRVALMTIEEALDERLSNLSLTRDSECAYMRLKEHFQTSRVGSTSTYVEVRLNKCYLKYIKNLYNYFFDRYDYIPLKILNEYLHMSLISDIDNISEFSMLNEDIKVSVLSSI